MSRTMIVRTIGLGRSMVNAWKEVGGWFPKRERSVSSKLDLMADNYGTDGYIFNFGDMGFTPSDAELEARGIDPDRYYNRPHIVRPLARPGSARRVVGHLMPKDPRTMEPDSWVTAWVKAPGQGGQGKTKIEGFVRHLPEIPADWDIQVHVTGTEFRVVTVGAAVVQVNERSGPNGAREYEWVGVRNADSDVKAVARAAARALGDERTIIGWDLIANDQQVLLFEGNTCPGTNDALARRIFDYVKGDSYADSHS